MGIKFNQVIDLMDEASLSPEQLAPYFGIGNMTLRRWKEQPGSKKIPSIYERSVLDGVYQLVIQGKLDPNSEKVRKILESASSLSFKAALKGLGVEDALEEGGSQNHEEKFTVALSKIGFNDKHRAEVDKSEVKIQGYKKLGQTWSYRISSLWTVVRSNKLSLVDKLVAYGALFYLIFPFDLIPDHIPVIGLLDDYAMLGFAIAYYLKRFPELVPQTPKV
jgi:uncharacterized membrane protein YkvA (DUF1232 family)